MTASKETVPELYPEDQKKVDAVLQKGPYKVDRKPFKVFVLLGVILGVLAVISGVSYLIAYFHGIV